MPNLLDRVRTVPKKATVVAALAGVVLVAAGLYAVTTSPSHLSPVERLVLFLTAHDHPRRYVSAAHSEINGLIWGDRNPERRDAACNDLREAVEVATDGGYLSTTIAEIEAVADWVCDWAVDPDDSRYDGLGIHQLVAGLEYWLKSAD